MHLHLLVLIWGFPARHGGTPVIHSSGIFPKKNHPFDFHLKGPPISGNLHMCWWKNGDGFAPQRNGDGTVAERDRMTLFCVFFDVMEVWIQFGDTEMSIYKLPWGYMKPWDFHSSPFTITPLRRHLPQWNHLYLYWYVVIYSIHGLCLSFLCTVYTFTCHVDGVWKHQTNENCQ